MCAVAGDHFCLASRSTLRGVLVCRMFRLGNGLSMLCVAQSAVVTTAASCTAQVGRAGLEAARHVGPPLQGPAAIARSVVGRHADDDTCRLSPCGRMATLRLQFLHGILILASRLKNNVPNLRIKNGQFRRCGDPKRQSPTAVVSEV